MKNATGLGSQETKVLIVATLLINYDIVQSIFWFFFFFLMLRNVKVHPTANSISGMM